MNLNTIQPQFHTDISASSKPKVVLIDAFDSFVYVIVQYIGELGCEPIVLRSHPDNIAVIEELRPDFLILGPGPGTPEDSGHVELVHHFKDKLPIFGVCLGMQAIGVAFGAQVRPAAHIMHGKNSAVEHSHLGVFKNFPQPTSVTRYHSLIIEEESLPADLRITAKSIDDGYIMGVQHDFYSIEGVQFHPESIGTVSGLQYLTTFIDTYLPQKLAISST